MVCSVGAILILKRREIECYDFIVNALEADMNDSLQVRMILEDIVQHRIKITILIYNSKTFHQTEASEH